MELTQCILARRSGRNYTDTPIEDAVLNEILKAGLLAPSSRNLKSTDFIVTSNRESLAFLSNSKVGGSGMLKNAACAIIVIGNSSCSDAWIEDGSIAMTNMMLRAADLGIANCWVQIRNRFSAQDGKNGKRSAEELIREHFGIPNTYSVLAVLSLGYPSDFNNPYRWEDADFSKVHKNHF